MIDPMASFAPGIFAGTTALITGGSGGIGHPTAVGFATYGANVVVAARNADRLATTVDAVEAAGAKGLAIPCDVRELDDVDRLRDEALGRFGTIDFLVNCAGGQFMADPFSISDRGWRSVIDLNLNGTWNLCTRFIPSMRAARRGSIVNVITTGAFEAGAPLMAHSGAARAGVVNLTRSLAPYLQASGVRINAVAPGTTVSPAMAAHYGTTVEEMQAKAGRLRLAEPHEIAPVILFLCTPAATMLNGAVLVADAAASQMNEPALDQLLDAVED